MQNLALLHDDEIIPVGSILRLYGVGRSDVMKIASDWQDRRKKSMDYYEYILVDIRLIKPWTFSLINVTRDNDNRGAILCLLGNNTVNEMLTAKQLKNYFGSNSEVEIDLNR